MRDYATVRPQFWTGATGKALRERGPEAVVVAMYLMTSPHSNMSGIYYLPMIYLAHETGLGEKGASKGLRWAIEAGFCTYDDATEHVFVHEMARFQIGNALAAKDKRCVGIANELAKVPEGALRLAFWQKYHDAFHLPSLPESSSPTEAPSKPLRSQEQEQEQERAKAIGLTPSPVAASGRPARINGFAPIIDTYHAALPGCTHVTVLNPKRKRRLAAVRVLAKQVCESQGWPYDERQFFGAYWAECAQDPWMRGEVANPKNPRWHQNIDVLLAEDRFAGVMDRAIQSLKAEQP